MFAILGWNRGSHKVERAVHSYIRAIPTALSLCSSACSRGSVMTKSQLFVATLALFKLVAGHHIRTDFASEIWCPVLLIIWYIHIIQPIRWNVIKLLSGVITKGLWQSLRVFIIAEIIRIIKHCPTEIALRPRSCHAHFFRVPVFSEPRISSW